MNVIHINETNYITATVVTHDGVFHADEVLAVAALAILYPGLGCVRTRDKSIIATCELAVDVGGGKFDHHQRDGAGIRENGVPYAAAGLIWKCFGYRIAEAALRISTSTLDTSRVYFGKVAKIIDEEFISLVDAVDCGEPVSSPQGWGFSALISGFNPSFGDRDDPRYRDHAFKKAVEMAKAVLLNKISEAAGRLASQAMVEKAIADQDILELLVLPIFLPWQNVVRDNPDCKELLFVVFPAVKGYNVQAVPTGLPDRSSRKLLPEAWRGLPEEELRNITGIADATFCHPAGFIGGAETLEGAIAMAKVAMAAE